MSFINTVDVIGDAALTNSIIDGSITEIADSHSTSIGEYAFNGCVALTTADFSLVTKIGANAFGGCNSLKALALRLTTKATLSNTSALNSTPIASGTGYIYVPGALLDSYKADSKWSTYANQFRKLENYTVDGTITGELDTTRCRVRFFNGDTLLQESYVPYGQIPVYTGAEPTPEVDYAFVGWTPAIVAVTGDADYVAQFKFAASIARKIVDRTITDYTSEIATQIGNGAFYDCSKLTSVNIPNVTSIGDSAFYYCRKLASVNIPNVTSIGNGAFNRCSALVSVHLPAVPPSIQTTSFSGISAECVFYIPTGSSSAYQAHSNWSSMMTQYSFVEEDR